MLEPNLIEDLTQRELIAQLAGGDELVTHLRSGERTVYCGFDPTAESLHVGNMVPLLALARFQRAGHRPIALVGGATGLIGDPSFKASERQLNSQDLVLQWVERIKPQLAQFLDFDCGSRSALLVNNLDWTQQVGVLDFLRDIGKHFSINAMIQKDSVKQRIERSDAGISYTEFSYMILQSFDFAELNRRYGCTVQVGGSDQWGNITAGIDLTRRLNHQQVYGVTLPLVTKADGSKFGKTENGTIWISPTKTSPYSFYQFWLNVADADVYRFLSYFTYLPVSVIQELKEADSNKTGKPEGQKVLAEEVTRLVHGQAGLNAAQRITQALFSAEFDRLSTEDLQQLALDGLPCFPVNCDSGLVDALVLSGLAKSNRVAREFIESGAVQVNGNPVSLADTDRPMFEPTAALGGQYFILRRGKRQFGLLKLL